MKFPNLSAETALLYSTDMIYPGIHYKQSMLSLPTHLILLS